MSPERITGREVPATRLTEPNRFLHCWVLVNLLRHIYIPSLSHALSNIIKQLFIFVKRILNNFSVRVLNGRPMESIDRTTGIVFKAVFAFD